MNKTLTTDLKAAQDIASTAQVLAVIALVIIVLTIVSQGVFPIGARLLNDAMSWRERANDIGLKLIALLPTFLLYEAVNQLRYALQHYRDGEFFSATAASRVARAGDYATAAMLSMMLVVPNLLLWVAHSGGFDVHIESEFIGMLAFALFVASVGRILAAATQLKSENDSFV